MSIQEEKMDTVLIKEIDIESIDTVPNIKSFKNKHPGGKRIYISLIVLFVILVSLLRVPYLGTYIDAFMFEYLTGCTKYLVYI